MTSEALLKIPLDERLAFKSVWLPDKIFFSPLRRMKLDLTQENLLLLLSVSEENSSGAVPAEKVFRLGGIFSDGSYGQQ